MKQEFITLHGKISFQDNSLIIRDFYSRVNERLIGKLIFSVLPWIYLLLLLFKGLNDPASKTQFVVWSVLCLLSMVYSYELLFLESYSKRISMDRIQSYGLKPDRPGYITYVVLKLKSGKKRFIGFRTSELEHEAFAQFLQAQGVPGFPEPALK